ncbi:DUF7344 domain-containing protein [Halosimplex halophilum]|uniref:DUF7344 domain-containing protein n=1 Tax=Halosimplex halophilum TaxID=2559572 RepID=UPI001FE58BA4|nr:hypothetical protein [Halosimplex halophilum]
MVRSDGADGDTEGATPATDGGETGDSTARDDTDRLPASAVADLRASERRRRALDCLAERADPIPVSDLARHVVAVEREEPADAVPDEAVDEARRDLFQQHLPKLTATGVVRYDSLVGTVELAAADPRVLGDDGDDADEGDTDEGDADGRTDDRVAPE